MELEYIIKRARNLAFDMFPTVTGEDAEMEILHMIADEIMIEASIKDNDVLRKSIVNMFVAGGILNNKTN